MQQLYESKNHYVGAYIKPKKDKNGQNMHFYDPKQATTQ